MQGGVEAIGRTYKVHLDGYNFLPYLQGEAKKGPREEVFYFSDDGDLTALRWNDWKLIFLEQKAYTTLRAWIEPWTQLRIPLIFNLRRDPYERSYRTSNTYYDWLLDRAYFLVPAQSYVAEFLATFQEFPPRQKAGELQPGSGHGETADRWCRPVVNYATIHRPLTRAVATIEACNFLEFLAGTVRPPSAASDFSRIMSRSL